jgi:hypothetical protein
MLVRIGKQASSIAPIADDGGSIGCSRRSAVQEGS